MFIKTIAVGPLEPTEFWVTGGTAVARPLRLMQLIRALVIDRAPREVPLISCRGIAKGLRKDMMTDGV